MLELLRAHIGTHESDLIKFLSIFVDILYKTASRSLIRLLGGVSVYLM